MNKRGQIKVQRFTELELYLVKGFSKKQMSYLLWLFKKLNLIFNIFIEEAFIESSEVTWKFSKISAIICSWFQTQYYQTNFELYYFVQSLFLFKYWSVFLITSNIFFVTIILNNKCWFIWRFRKTHLK